jgi:hypothetical protein
VKELSRDERAPGDEAPIARGRGSLRGICDGRPISLRAIGLDGQRREALGGRRVVEQ